MAGQHVSTSRDMWTGGALTSGAPKTSTGKKWRESERLPVKRSVLVYLRLSSPDSDSGSTFVPQGIFDYLMSHW